MARHYFLAAGIVIPESLESACSCASGRVESLGKNRYLVHKGEPHKPTMARGRVVLQKLCEDKKSML